MRDIPWDEDLAQLIYKHYFKLQGNNTKNTTWGHVAEAIVKKYYNLPVELSDVPDPGYDMILWDNVKVDIKANVWNSEHFNDERNGWSVNCYHGLRADVYLFVTIDKDKKKIVLQGYLPREDIIDTCKKIRYGEYVPGYPFPSNGDCYRVAIKDIIKIS